MSQQKRPVKTYRHGTKDRSVEAAVWKNETEDGRVFFNATFKAQYKEGGNWNDTTSYGAGDLFQLIRCATDASAFIFFETLRQGRDEDRAAA